MTLSSNFLNHMQTWQEALPGPLPIRCLLEAPDGSLWVGGVLDGVHVYK